VSTSEQLLDLLRLLLLGRGGLPLLPLGRDDLLLLLLR
jgi:hypothetical protein